MNNITLAVDFDGTVVKHEFPDIGEPVPNALPCLLMYQKRGWKIVLNTMRSGVFLDEAVAYLESNSIKLHGINHNPDQSSWTTSPKVYGQLYIDDAAAGCPLIYPSDHNRPYVDWVAVNNIIEERVQKRFY